MLHNKNYFNFQGYRKPKKEEIEYIKYQIYRIYDMKYQWFFTLLTWFSIILIFVIDITLIIYCVSYEFHVEMFIGAIAFWIVPGILYFPTHKSGKIYRAIKKGNFKILDAIAYEYKEPVETIYNPNRLAIKRGEGGLEIKGYEKTMLSGNVKFKTQYGQICDEFQSINYRFCPTLGRKNTSISFPLYIIKFENNTGFLITTREYINPSALYGEEEFCNNRKNSVQ